MKLATAGDIRLERVTGDAELATATGDVRAGEIDGSAVIKNSNGDTRIGEVGGDLRVKAANGDIEVEHSHGSVSAKTANGHIRVGSIHRGSLVAETANGPYRGRDRRAGSPPGSTSTRGIGHVHNGLDATEAPGSADEQVEVRARTGFGDITIRREAQRSDRAAFARERP